MGAGTAIGFGVIRWFQAHPIFEWEGFLIRPAFGAWIFLGPALLVLFATLVAGIFPAWRAARVDPARVLRGVE